MPRVTTTDRQAGVPAVRRSAEIDDLEGQLAGGQTPCTSGRVDPEAWFPVADDPDLSYVGPQTRIELRRRAGALCDGCPVLAACLDLALTRRERYGVWGGMTARDRDKLLRRPAKRRAVA